MQSNFKAHYEGISGRTNFTIQVSANFVGAILPFALSILTMVTAYSFLRGRFPTRRTIVAVEYNMLIGLAIAIPLSIGGLLNGVGPIVLIPLPLALVSLLANLAMPAIGIDFALKRGFFMTTAKGRAGARRRDYVALALVSYSTVTFAALLVDTFFLLIGVLSTLIAGGNFAFTYGIAGASDTIVTSGELCLIMAIPLVLFLWIAGKSPAHKIP